MNEREVNDHRIGGDESGASMLKPMRTPSTVFAVRAFAVLAIGAIGVGLVSCQAEPEPEPQPAVTLPVPIPEPEPEPEPMPGNGPECPTDHCVTVGMTGDMLFHQGLWTPYAIPTNDEGHSFDFVPLLEGQRAYLESTDLAICQMETPLAPWGGPYLGYPAFSTPPELAFAAKAVGYDVCTTASNHTIDQGTAGLVRTLDLLDEAGIQHTGSYRTEEEAQEVLIVEANGAKIAIITATFSLNGIPAEFPWQADYPLEPERAIAKAKEARAFGADLVIGVQHAGTEYATLPDLQQIGNAEILTASGEFDFIYGHHTHSIQPLEKMGETWVAYGLGNGISESALFPPEHRVNNEFLFLRVQFALQDDGSWRTNDVAWSVATNVQAGVYKWCSVASDLPQGVCQGEAFDTDVRERTRATVNALGAAEHGARELLITQE